MGEHTKDAVYQDAELRFKELEQETKKLHDESQKYFTAINNMLSSQMEFSQAMTEIYKPISGRASDPETMKIEGNPEGIRACEEYETIVKDLQETLAPELDMIETRVIRPANELLDVINVIRKSAVKREHKKLDYDRHRASLKKLQDKKDRGPKDEKNMWKAENDVETSTQEFNYFNDLLKDELPKLFALERAFIQPLFQSFYYMQLNIFYTLHIRMQECDIGYFDLTLDVEEAFEKKRGDVQEQAEGLSIVKFKKVPQKRPPKYGGGKSSIIADKEQEALGDSKTPAATTAGYNRQSDIVENPPPPYSPPSGSASASSPGLAAIAAAKAKPPPPKPKPKRFAAAPTSNVETVTALYDYAAQAEGDLSFKAGDVIEIVKRTPNENEWWSGKVDGKSGEFPGKKYSLLVRWYFPGLEANC